MSFFWPSANSLQHGTEKRKKNRRKRKTKVRNELVGVHKQSVDKVSVATMTTLEEFSI